MMRTRVLLVEDERIIAEDIRGRLEGMGYAVAGIVSSGAEAIKAANETRPDLILMDIKLGGTMDGIEAASRIRETVDAPLIYTTANADELTLERAGKTAPSGYLVKPIEDQELNATIMMAFHRHEAEKAVRKREKKFRTLFDSMNDAIFIHDMDGHFLEVNRVASERLGYTRDELLQMGPAMIDGSGHGSQLSEPMKELSDEGHLIFETAHVTSKGEVIPTEISARVIEFDEKPAILSVARDISERKRMDALLRLSEKQYRALFENSIEGIFRSTPDGRCITANPAHARLFGYDSPRELMEDYPDIAGQHYANPEDRATFRKVIEAEGVIKGFEVQFIDKYGKTVWASLNARVVRDDTGTVLCYEGTTEDITRRRGAEEALKQSERRLSNIIDFLPEATFVIDLEGRIIAWNRAIEEMTGFSAERMLGKGDYEYAIPFYGDRRPVLIDFLSSWNEEIEKQYSFIRQEGDTLITETDMPCVNGQKRTLWAKARPLCDDQGNIVGTIESIRDITERKQMEEDLVRAKEEAEMANRIKSRFLANMSHEIRTPLNGVIGMAGLLMETDLNEEQKDYAYTVHNSAGLLLDIVNDILDFSKVEAGRIDLESVDLNLRKAVEEVADMLSPRAHDKGVELLCVIDPGTPVFVKGDMGRLCQVLGNLVSNAVKFTDSGEVSLRVRREEERGQTVKIRFDVSDTGIGIPGDKMNRLFRAFSQVDASTTRKYGGTGLGLAIARHLVDIMGGTIGVESEEGKGSTFWFTVLLEKQTPVAPEHGAEGRIDGKRILIVDDNRASRGVMAGYADRWGVRYDTASNGLDALRLLREARAAKDPFHVALVDMVMPAMSGEELGQRIKGDPEMKSTVLVLLTSTGAAGNNRNARDANFAACLPKPVKGMQLLDCLLMVTGRDFHEGANGAMQTEAQNPLLQRRRKGRVLVAEDNATNQKVAARMLEKLGCTVDVVSDGRYAVEASARIPYDILFMDIEMPEMDGFTATRLIRERENGGTSNVPIVAMTAHAIKGYMERCLEAGMNDYLSKPVEIAELARTVEKYLPLSLERMSCGGGKPGAGECSVDREALLCRFDGDEVFCRELLATYVDEIRKRLALIHNALESGDTMELGRQAHAMKGASAMMEARVLHGLAGDTEKAIRDGDRHLAIRHIVAFEKEFEGFKTVPADDGVLNVLLPHGGVQI